MKSDLDFDCPKFAVAHRCRNYGARNLVRQVRGYGVVPGHRHFSFGPAERHGRSRRAAGSVVIKCSEFKQVLI